MEYIIIEIGSIENNVYRQSKIALRNDKKSISNVKIRQDLTDCEKICVVPVTEDLSDFSKTSNPFPCFLPKGVSFNTLCKDCIITLVSYE
ncbi:MAG: hypothetical protein IMY73_01950 [Bacteroidetes bacterium]|nr:hypothetical protein [Bacteroidota bacterium]